MTSHHASSSRLSEEEDVETDIPMSSSPESEAFPRGDRSMIYPSTIKIVEKPQMLEINPGIWDGLTPDQAKKYYPEDWERFSKDPYSYRAPRAESYHDLSGKKMAFFLFLII